jgi:outer membrane protein OmpA-like peptidoglycan-associated protein
MAAVAATRAWIAASTTHCKTPDSTTPRCLAERAHDLDLARAHCKTPRCKAERARTFAERRNAEIDASMAAVKRVRIIGPSLTYCMSPDSTTPRCEAERAREFAKARNAEIDASMATVASVREFARARNAEIDASLAAVKRERAFASARNAEINASMATVASVREFERARNAEINASLAAVERDRARAFAAARNAEINASMAASKARRALRLALEWSRQERLETGAINLPKNPRLAAAAPVVRRTRHFGPCREAGQLPSPLRFSDGSAEIEPAMKPELDRIAMMARSCPAVRFEIHGYSDNSGPAQVNRHLAQRRAQATLEYLVGSGVDRKRLAAIGRANAQPPAPNTNQDNRALSRRVEITIRDPATFAAARRVMWDLAELLDPTYLPPLARLSP